MGNALSKTDIKPDQPPEDGFGEMGFPINKKFPLRGPFFIETTEPINGIHKFQLYRIDKDGIYTKIFSFETCDYLNNAYHFFYDGAFVKFVFETESLNTEFIHSIDYSVLFSKTIQSEMDLWNFLISMPYIVHIDRQIFHLTGNYWYHHISVGPNLYEFYIVESSDKTHVNGFECKLKSGDTIIQKINVESSSIPFVRNDEEGNLVIASADEDNRFVSIPIRLPV